MGARDFQKFVLGLSLPAIAGAMIVTGPVGCTSVPKKVDISSSASPTEEAARFDEDIKQGFNEHYDVLAQSDFNRAQDKLNQAKKEIANGKKNETVLSTIGMGRAYLNRAKEQADKVQEKAKGILEARTAALNAGAHSSARARGELKQQDDDLRAEINNLEKGTTGTERWAALQRGYLAVELHAIQDGKLGNVRAKIDEAVKNGARKNSPNALAQAERDLRNAENMIAANRHNEEAYRTAAETAAQSAQLLTEVLAATKRPEGVINEDAAKTIVLQSRKLSHTTAALGEASQQAAEASQELSTTAAAMKLNKALESARKEFSSNEADVYRQGDKLLIRLKAVNFPVGRADLPAQSLPLLSKVKSIAEELNPAAVVVQGHTDSTGKKQFNKVLSQERAETVANYLAENGVDQDKINAIGYGYEKPLASNKSKMGRAENRRVDIVITPGPTTVGNTQQQSQ